MIKDKKGISYCPLCTKITNFVFPLEENMEKESKFIRNLLIQIFTNDYGDYDVDFLFLLIFKSLLVGSGLFSMKEYKMVNLSKKSRQYFQ